MKIDVLTLFPEVVRASLDESIIGRASAGGALEIAYYQIRDYSENKQKKVDDTPYGGGPGMLMTCQPILSCYRDAVNKAGKKPYTVYMSPRGTRFDASAARRLAKEDYLLILCGHYEGVDQRVLDEICDEEISLGDFVLTGGELPAAVVIDSVSRFVPGVLGCGESSGEESFENLLLEYPQYTKPAEFEGRKVPEVLLGGNHQDIDDWRRKQSELLTKELRPDLFQRYEVSEYCRNRVVYLDNSATTRQLDEVTEAMGRTAGKFYGNPSSLHRLGLLAEKELKSAREVLAESIGANSSELVFTGGGSESNNLAIRGYFKANKHAGNHLIVSAVEHPSVLETAKSLEADGIRVDLCPVDSKGRVDLEALERLICPDTAMISVMTVNSETGTVMPIREIADLKNRINPKIVLHTDAVQGYGKMDLKVRELGCDMLSVSGHKIHGPRGVGFLYVRKGIRLAPVIFGGGQENGLRSGTENLPAIVGLKTAAEACFPVLSQSYENVKKCRDLLSDLLTERFGDKVKILSDGEAALPYILNVSFAPLRSEVVLHALESRNVYLSVGSACSSHKKNRSHVLTAMGVPIPVIDGSVRISFNRFVTEDEIRLAFEAICDTVKELRRAQYKR